MHMLRCSRVRWSNHRLLPNNLKKHKKRRSSSLQKKRRRMKGRGIFSGGIQMSANLHQPQDQKILSTRVVQVQQLVVVYLEEDLTDHKGMRDPAGRMEMSLAHLVQILVASKTAFHPTTMVVQIKARGGTAGHQLHPLISSWQVLLNQITLLPYSVLTQVTIQILHTTADHQPESTATIET